VFKKLLIRNVSCLLGLDRFSQFFIHPLLKKEAMTREREAVDSEYQVRVYLMLIRMKRNYVQAGQNLSRMLF
jgi:secreted Zn-dependent insulinase-like peptidase